MTTFGDSTTTAHYDPECVNLILKFIHTLETKLVNLSSLYPKIIKLALSWLHSEQVAYQSLIVLTVVIQNGIRIDDGGGDKDFLSLLTAKLPTFIATLNTEATPTTMEGYKRLGALLHLLRTMLRSSICKDVSETRRGF